MNEKKTVEKSHLKSSIHAETQKNSIINCFKSLNVDDMKFGPEIERILSFFLVLRSSVSLIDF